MVNIGFFKALKGGLNKLGDLYNENKDNSFISFIEKIRNSTEKIIKAIDTVLKKKGIDLEKAYEKTKRKVKDSYAFGKETIVEIGKAIEERMSDETKDKLKKVKEKAQNTKDKVRKFISDKTGLAPPEGKSENSESNTLIDSLIGKVSGGISFAKNKISNFLSKDESDAADQDSTNQDSSGSIKKHFAETRNLFNKVLNKLIETKNKFLNFICKKAYIENVEISGKSLSKIIKSKLVVNEDVTEDETYQSKGFLRSAKDKLKGFKDKLYNFFSKNKNNIALEETESATNEEIIQNKSIFKSASDKLKETKNRVNSYFSNVFKSASDKLKETKDKIHSFLTKSNTGTTVEEKQDVTEEENKQKKKIFEELSNKLKDTKNKVSNYLNNLFKSASDKLKETKDKIHSSLAKPNNEINTEEKQDIIEEQNEQKESIFEELTNKLKDTKDKVNSYFSNAFKSASDKIKETKGKIKDTKDKVSGYFGNLFKSASDKLKETKDKIHSFLTKSDTDATVEEKQDVAEDKNEQKKSIFERITSKFKETKDRVNSYFSNVFKSASDKFKETKDKIHSFLTKSDTDATVEEKQDVAENKNEQKKSVFERIANKLIETKNKFLNFICKKAYIENIEISGKPLSRILKKKLFVDKDVAEDDTYQSKGFLRSAKDKLIDFKDRIVNSLKRKRLASTEERIQDDLQRTKEQIERQKKKRASAKKENKNKEKDKGKKGSIFSKILAKLGTIAGFLFKGLKAIIWTPIKWLGTKIIAPVIKKAAGWLGGFFFKILQKTFSWVIPGLTKSIGNVFSNAIKGLLNPKNLISGAKGLFKGLVRPGLGLLKSVGGALVRSAAGALLSPVGLGVGAAVALTVGAYYAYKYFTRNNLQKGIPGLLTKLRLLQYGFNDENKDEYHKAFKLEGLLKKKLKYTNNKLLMDKLTEDEFEEIYDIFSINAKEQPEKKKIFDSWFVNRFLKVLFEHVKALYKINNNIYLDEIDKLKPLEFKKFLDLLTVSSSIYNYKQLPLDTSLDSSVTIEIVNEHLSKIREEINKELKEKSLLDNKVEDKEKQISNKEKDTKTEKVNTNERKEVEYKPPVIEKNKFEANHTEAEDVKTNGASSATLDRTTEKVNNINKAEGPLVKNDSLTGIQLKKEITQDKFFSLEPNIRELFSGMAKEYNATTGKNIIVSEAFRTRKDQEEMRRKKGRQAARPGTSLHEFGLALDINHETADELDKLGLLRKYGFTRPIGGEPWHIEPIGISLDPFTSKTDENYKLSAILASPGKGGDGYGTIPNLPESKKFTRNIPYQLKIFNQASDNDIDLSKMTKSDIISTFNKESSKSQLAKVETKDNSITPVNEKTNESNRIELAKEAEEKPKTNTISSPYTSSITNASTNALGIPTLSFNDVKTKEINNIIKTNNKQLTNVAQPVTNSINLDTGNIENILNEQLLNLKTMVTILTSINDKIDLDKLNAIFKNNSPELINVNARNDVVTLSNYNVSLRRSVVS